MPSALDKVRMLPASESDSINPGCFYFACLNLQRKSEPESYWIVLRAPKEWLPDGFFDTRPVQIRVFPFWIVGKDQRVWLPRSSLFYLDRSQREIFVQREQRHDFVNSLILISSFQNAEAALTHFKRKIVNATQQYNERRERVEKTAAQAQRSISPSPFSGRSPGDHAGPLKRKPDAEHIERGGTSFEAVIGHRNRALHNENKRQRLDLKKIRNPSPVPNPDRFPSLTTVIDLTSDTPTRPKTKMEQELIFRMDLDEPVKEVPEKPIKEEEDDSLVRIYVNHGINEEEYVIETTTVKKHSPLLASWIEETPESQGKYIKHAELHDVDPKDFLPILEWMTTGDYQPTWIMKQKNKSETGALHECATAEDYSAALVKGARLYVLTKKLEIPNMTGFIVDKISRTEFIDYTNLGLIEFGRIIFTRLPYKPRSLVRPVYDRTFMLDSIDRWAIERLADRFMGIMRSEVEHSKYLEMISACQVRLVHAEILDQVAEKYRELHW